MARTTVEAGKYERHYQPFTDVWAPELMLELKQKYTIAIVTHNLQQAARVADRTAFMGDYGKSLQQRWAVKPEGESGH